MNAPHRLKHDPTVSDDLRDALLEEEEIVEDYDLDSLRQKVVAGQAPAASGPRWGTRWLAVIVVSGFTAALVSIALQPGDPVVIEPTAAPVIEVVPTGDHQLPQRSIVEGEPHAPARDDGSADAAVAPPLQPRAPDAVTEPVAPPDAEPDAEPAIAPSTPTGPVEPVQPPAPSGLAAELAAYNLGLDAAERGQWRAARDAYTRYLQEWPEGQMRTEGWLGLLTATVESSSPAAAERLAAQMLDRGGLGSRREDVVLVRAEALVQLDRCDEALASVEDFRRGSRVNSIKQSCKRARRSD